jgi:hypothetical protein
MTMAYIFCDSCGIGFHSNVKSCPECGRTASRAFESDGHTQRFTRGRHSLPELREDVESEVCNAIYGWHSGTVERCDRTAPAGAATEPA